MKTRLLILVLLIVCFSCGTNNKPVSDAQKEKIKGEIKELVNTFNKGCEEVNPEILIPLYSNAPDYVYVGNGKILSYQESIDTTKYVFSLLSYQKGTIISENYIVLDNTTVLFTQNSKWIMNFKDGRSDLQDPWIMQLLFKKIDNKWKIVSSVESGTETIVNPSNPPIELNQVELHKQFAGSWKGEVGKDTTCFWDVKPYGTGYECYSRYVTKGKVFSEVKSLWGYNKNLNKFINAEMVKGMDNGFNSSWFTAVNSCFMIPYDNINNQDSAALKWNVEFVSPDLFEFTTVINNKPAKVDMFAKVKN